MGSLMSSGGGNFSQAMPIAAGMGLVAAFSALGKGLHAVAGFFYSALGVIASIPTIARFVSAARCTGYPPVGFRIASLVLLVLIFGISAFASGIFRGGLPEAATGLAFYGAVGILVTSASFLADGGYSGDWIAMAVMVLGAGLLGWFVVAASTAVLAVAGVAFGMRGIYASSLASGCQTANFSGAALIVMFCIAYFVCRAVIGKFSRHG